MTPAAYSKTIKVVRFTEERRLARGRKSPVERAAGWASTLRSEGWDDDAIRSVLLGAGYRLDDINKGMEGSEE